MLKRILRHLLHHRGFDVTRLPSVLIDRPEARLYPRYELLVPYVTARAGDVFFVQVGANDGVRADPIHEIVVRHKWRGILVEPQEDMFAALKRNYGGVDGLTFVNAAISDRDETRDLYRVRPGGDGPAFLNGLASFRREVLLKHADRVPDLASRIEVKQVKCLTLDALLKQAGVDRIDLLQVDVEGFDAEVVRMVDLKRIRPWVICYEWVHLSQEDYQGCARRLVENGYRLWPIDMDMMAVRMER